jgi:hypothetical protein
MKRGMAEVVVETKPESDLIWITQNDGAGDEHNITLLPDQIPLLIDWLKEAHQELRDDAPAMNQPGFNRREIL